MKELSIVITKHCKALTLTIIFVASLLAAGGCTRNNGDIGKIFGQWQLQSIVSDTDGIIPPALPEAIAMYWAFQSSTVKVDLVGNLHTVKTSYGNFRLTDDTLFLSFPDEGYPQLIPGVGRDSEWQLLRFSGSELILRLTASDGSTSIWSFRKW